MNAKAEAALNAIRKKLEDETRPLGREAYYHVLEALQEEVEARLDAVKSELKKG